MTQHQYKIAIQREIKTLNQKIDEKILYGWNYADDARRHKQLMARMRRLQKGNFLSRVKSLFTTLSHA